MDFSAGLILHTTLGILILTECNTFLMPDFFMSAVAISNPRLLYTVDFLFFQRLENSHLATVQFPTTSISLCSSACQG